MSETNERPIAQDVAEPAEPTNPGLATTAAAEAGAGEEPVIEEPITEEPITEEPVNEAPVNAADLQADADAEGPAAMEVAGEDAGQPEAGDTAPGASTAAEEHAETADPEPADAQAGATTEAEATAPAENEGVASAAPQAEAATNAVEPAAAAADEEATAPAENEGDASAEPQTEAATHAVEPAAAAAEAEATAPAENEGDASAEPQAEAATDAVEPAADVEAARAPGEAAAPSEPEAAAEETAGAGEPDDEARGEAPEPAAKPEPRAEPEAEVEVPLAAAAVPFAAAKEANNPVEGKVIGWNAGGFHVASDGVTAFCPRSLMELGNRPKPPANYVNNTYQFHVLEIRDTGRRIVLTRRPAIRSERKRGLDEIRAKLESREPVTGKVTSVADYGAFVDLSNGLGGLVHRTQISRIRSGEPADLVKVGEEVQAVVTKIEPRSGKRGVRISLSMKALEADPWKETARQFSAGDRFTGKVARHTEFGIFVELAPGLDGLIHTSRLPIGKSMSAPEFTEGKQVEGWVVEVEPRRRRIALSLRETPTTDPWKPLDKQYAEGAEVQGRVEQVSRFGVFVELEPGLTGLLPMSSLKLPDGAQANRSYPPGREVKVVIESIDRKRRRLGLAPPGSQLVGSKADYKQYRQRQKKDTGLNAMAAAFAKLQDPG